MAKSTKPRSEECIDTATESVDRIVRNRVLDKTDGLSETRPGEQNHTPASPHSSVSFPSRPPTVQCLLDQMSSCPTFKPDDTIWPGIERLVALAQDRKVRERLRLISRADRKRFYETTSPDAPGRVADSAAIGNWIGSNLRRLKLNPEMMTIAEAIEAIEQAYKETCPQCDKVIEGPERDEPCCYTCQLAMGYLVTLAKYSHTHPLLFQETGPEIRSLSCDAFDHQSFTIDTWVRMVDWLATFHGLSGTLLDRTPRTEVIELLRARLGSKTIEAKVQLVPILASQAVIARFLGRSDHTPGLLTQLRDEGILSFDQVTPRKNKVWFTDPKQHAEAREWIKLSPKARRGK
jgi:hypothetical protein